MLKLESIEKDAVIAGLQPGQIVRIVTTDPVSDDSLTVYYKTPYGRLHERMLFRTNEAKLFLPGPAKRQAQHLDNLRLQ